MTWQERNNASGGRPVAIRLLYDCRGAVKATDALRTVLLAPTVELREILDNPW
jgi:hypothetical protein